MNPRLIAGGVLASLWLLGLLTWAVEYRLQVVNLDALTVLAHIDNSGPAPHGEARKSHLEARLDNGANRVRTDTGGELSSTAGNP